MSLKASFAMGGMSLLFVCGCIPIRVISVPPVEAPQPDPACGRRLRAYTVPPPGPIKRIDGQIVASPSAASSAAAASSDGPGSQFGGSLRTYDEGFSSGRASARRVGLLGWGGGGLATPVHDSSPDYQRGYSNGYNQTLKKRRTSSALIGGVAAVILAGVVFSVALNSSGLLGSEDEEFIRPVGFSF